MNAVRQLNEEEKKAIHPYRVGALFNVSLVGVPSVYKGVDIPDGWILNQQLTEADNDECGGCALSLALGLREGVLCDPHFVWMMARQRAGAELSDFGVSNVDLDSVARKVGALRRVDSPYTFETPRNVIADPTSWDIAGLCPKALEQLSGGTTWVKAEGGLDAFDMYRASAWKLQNQYKRPHSAVFGMMYNYPSTQVDITEIMEYGTGHDVVILPWWDGDFVYMANSMGEQAGNKGIFRVHRKVFNRWAEPYGCFIPIDATRAQIDSAVASGTKIDSWWNNNIIIQFLKKIINLKIELLNLKKNETGAIPSKWLLPAIIWQESGGIDSAIGDDGHAYGSLQIWQSYMSDVYPFRTAKECLGNRKLSIDTFNGYMKRYATEKRIGKPITDEIIARIHNGGPNGHNKTATLVYWYGVRAKMKKLEAGQVEAELLKRITKIQ